MSFLLLRVIGVSLDSHTGLFMFSSIKNVPLSHIHIFCVRIVVLCNISPFFQAGNGKWDMCGLHSSFGPQLSQPLGCIPSPDPILWVAQSPWFSGVSPGQWARVQEDSSHVEDCGEAGLWPGLWLTLVQNKPLRGGLALEPHELGRSPKFRWCEDSWCCLCAAWNIEQLPHT